MLAQIAEFSSFHKLTETSQLLVVIDLRGRRSQSGIGFRPRARPDP
jgi:hypothetical protein